MAQSFCGIGMKFSRVHPKANNRKTDCSGGKHLQVASVCLVIFDSLAAGTPLIIEQLAVDGTKVYGVSKTGVYRLENENGTWKEIASEIPDSVTSLAVDGNVLYVGTQNSGMLRFNLGK